jgi:hypothetical protein
LGKILKVGIIPPIKYSERSSNLVLVKKVIERIAFYVDFCEVKWVVMDDFSPLPNIEMILQQVANDALTCFFSHQIKVKEVDKYKTTFITDIGTLNYQSITSGLSYVGTTFKKLVQITLE